jgi:hypothetical protein
MSAENELLAFWRRQIKEPGRHVAIVVELSALYALHQSQRQFRIQHTMVRDIAQRDGAQYFPMANGDAVVTLRRDRESAGEAMAAELLDWVLQDAVIAGDAISRRVTLFKLPEQTAELRELIARYVRDAQSSGELGALAGQGLLVAEPNETSLQGRLAPAMIERLEYRIMRSDIRSFVDNQSVFTKLETRAGAWTPSIQERRINLTSLREALFPQVEIFSRNSAASSTSACCITSYRADANSIAVSASTCASTRSSTGSSTPSCFTFKTIPVATSSSRCNAARSSRTSRAPSRR